MKRIVNAIYTFIVGGSSGQLHLTGTPDQSPDSPTDNGIDDSSYVGHPNPNSPGSIQSCGLEVESEDDLMGSHPNACTGASVYNGRPHNRRNDDVKAMNEHYKWSKYYHGRYMHYKQLFQELEKRNNVAQEVVARNELNIGKLTEMNGKKALEITNLKEATNRQKIEIKRLTGITAELGELVNKQTLEIRSLTETTAIQRNHIAELEGTVTAQGHNITELTETISCSAQGVNTATRDDEYFDAEFASLSGDIHQWVLRHFRDGPDVRHGDLLPTTQKSMRAIFLRYDEVLGTKVGTKEIEAAITERLSRHIFRSHFVFSVCGLKHPSLSKSLGGTDRERREWHAKTVDMIIKNGGFDDLLHERILQVETDLQNCFDCLAREGSKEQRYKALHNIVKKAARLGLETYRQISFFQLEKIDPGSRYLPWFMEDRSGIVDEDEEEGSGTHTLIVQMTLFPPVLRWGFDEAGKHSRLPVVIRKATVIAALPETEAETKAEVETETGTEKTETETRTEKTETETETGAGAETGTGTGTEAETWTEKTETGTRTEAETGAGKTGTEAEAEAEDGDGDGKTGAEAGTEVEAGVGKTEAGTETTGVEAGAEQVEMIMG